MSREERRNMIEFIERAKGTNKLTLVYMTDEEIEHIYNALYTKIEASCEC